MVDRKSTPLKGVCVQQYSKGQLFFRILLDLLEARDFNHVRLHIVNIYTCTLIAIRKDYAYENLF